MSLDKKFGLRTNPFRITPAISSEEIIWAGFPELKDKFERRIKRSLKIPNSSLVLNWGEYGSGKTHAARFFNKKSELERIAKDQKVSVPYSMVMALPKGREPVYDIYISIVDQLNIDQLRIDFKEITLDKVIENVTSNRQIQAVLKALFNVEVDSSLLKKYLYGNTTKTELGELNTTESINILRSLKGDTDFINFLSTLFNCITFEKKIYSAVIIWIDEFEDITLLSSSNIDKANNFFREIVDSTPNNLLIFLNLTQTALMGVSDLGEYIGEGVKSRIKERINFEIPSKEEFKKYLIELLNIYRIGSDMKNPYFPFEEVVIDDIISSLGNISLRAFNEAHSLLLELAEMDNASSPISNEFYETVKPEIIGWKND